MARADEEWVEDIVSAVADIRADTAGMDLVEFSAKPTIVRSALYSIAVIGEAAKNNSAAFKAAHPEIPWRAIAGTRDRIVHEYFFAPIHAESGTSLSMTSTRWSTRCESRRTAPPPPPDPPNRREETHMRIVALEEHYTVPRIVAGISPDAIARRGFPGPDFVWAQTTKRNELAELGPARLTDMDTSGITVQVLSVAGPGADLVPGQPGIDLARAYNDALAEACTRHPSRFRGFAHLPMLAPEAAADELERTVKDLGFHGVLVNGATDGRFLDDPAFEPLLACAETLDVPIYLHPGIPVEAVRNAYYDGLPGNFSFTMALSAWGWHADTAIHTLRLVLSGALDRHPGLKIVIGHMGEALPFMLDRIDETTAAQAKERLRRSVRQTILDQVWITTSGFFTTVPFMAALLSFGVDRIMFSVDYPFASNARARAFLDALPVSPADRAKIAHGNADRLLKLPV